MLIYRPSLFILFCIFITFVIETIIEFLISRNGLRILGLQNLFRRVFPARQFLAFVDENDDSDDEEDFDDVEENPRDWMDIL
uniref:Uncharacterized protein n=1 Tax=Caenorhabditis tropicalis TaxID=1561998 RepID=A0A1I7UNW6_9PELO